MVTLSTVSQKCVRRLRLGIDKPILGGMGTYLHKEVRLGISNNKL